MDEKSTQVTGNEELLEMLTTEDGPSQKTLHFLKMFARSYYTDQSLPQGINATCLN